MLALLAAKSGQDVMSLVTLVRRHPRIFDSLWYAALGDRGHEGAARDPGGIPDVDRILGGGAHG